MSTPNPPRASRRHAYRRWNDERIWREFFPACIQADSIVYHTADAARAAKLADQAYTEYRNRFPVREPELDDDEPAIEQGVRPQ